MKCLAFSKGEFVTFIFKVNQNKFVFQLALLHVQTRKCPKVVLFDQRESNNPLEKETLCATKQGESIAFVHNVRDFRNPKKLLLTNSHDDNLKVLYMMQQ